MSDIRTWASAAAPLRPFAAANVGSGESLSEVRAASSLAGGVLDGSDLFLHAAPEGHGGCDTGIGVARATRPGNYYRAVSENASEDALFYLDSLDLGEENLL